MCVNDPKPSREDRFVGGLLGLALGDALGAPYEGGPLEQMAWRFLGTTRQGEMRWTDDTQMSLDLAESLIACGGVDADDLAGRFAASYRWNRGYGPGAARILKRIRRGMPWRDANRSVYRDGSYGNGAAMRAPVVGLFHAADPDALSEAVRASALVTHAHPLGIEGARLVARAVAEALTDPAAALERAGAECTESEFRERVDVAREWLESGDQPEPDEIVDRLGAGIAATESCVTALYLALRFLDEKFAELHDFVARCGGDVDTIGAMSGAIWGAANGSGRLPRAELERLEQKERLESTARELYRAARA